MTTLPLEPLKERTKGVVLRRSAQNMTDAYARAKNRVACDVERLQPLPSFEGWHDLDSTESLRLRGRAPAAARIASAIADIILT